LKTVLSNPPVLAIFIPNRETELHTEASSHWTETRSWCSLEIYAAESSYYIFELKP